jgi:sugar phosphate isomerase/epimerase
MLVSARDCMPISVFGSLKTGLSAMGIDQVELELFRDNMVYSATEGDSRMPVHSKAEVDAYARHLADNQINCCALLLHNNFAADDIDDEVNWVSWAVHVTSMLGANAIRIDAIMSKEMEWPLEQRVQRFVDCMKRVLDATSDLEVGLGIENHGVQGNDPEFLDMVLGRVGSPRVGLNLDMANFYWRGYPLSRVHEIIKHFAPGVKHTHAKNVNYPQDKREIEREMGWEYGTYASPLREGDINLPWVAKTLKEAGYAGTLCIEDESLGRFDAGKQKEVLIDDAKFLKEVVAAL